MRSRVFDVCPQCNHEVSRSNFDRHVGSKSCQNGGTRKTKVNKHPWDAWCISSDLYRLPCGYEGNKISCRNYLIANSLVRDGKRVSNFVKYNEDVRTGIRKAPNFRKPMSEEQKKLLSNVLKKYRSENPQFHTPESRKKMSEYRKKLHQENPEKHLNRMMANNRKKMTYPERVAHDWFQDQMIYAPHNQFVSGYYPDFVVGNKIIVEIDGERWHSSEDQILHDQKRDAKLKGLGYIIYRIRSKENIHNRLTEIFGNR